MTSWCQCCLPSCADSLPATDTSVIVTTLHNQEVDKWTPTVFKNCKIQCMLQSSDITNSCIAQNGLTWQALLQCIAIFLHAFYSRRADWQHSSAACWPSIQQEELEADLRGMFERHTDNLKGKLNRQTWKAVRAVRGTPAAASKPRLAGMSATSSSGRAMYSAYVPVRQNAAEARHD